MTFLPPDAGPAPNGAPPPSVKERAAAVPAVVPTEWLAAAGLQLRTDAARSAPSTRGAAAAGGDGVGTGARAESRGAALASSEPRTLRDIQANTAGQRRFLAASSPWNTRVPPSATYAPISGIERYGAALTSWHPNWPSVAIYYARRSDPVVAVRWNWNTWSPVAEGRWKRWGNPPAVEARILAESWPSSDYRGNPYSTQRAELKWGRGLPKDYDRWRQEEGAELRVHVPRGAVPTPDSDGFTVVVQPDGRALEMYSPVVLRSGTWISMMYSFTDPLRGMGIGAENGRRASMIPSYAGVITDEDVASGSIDHAIVLMVPPSMLTTAFTPPALAFDNDPNYSGTVPMGTRFALPRDLDLAALDLRSEIGRMVARAAQDYGMIVGDRGGSGISLVTQYAPRSPLLTQRGEAEQHDMNAIVRNLRTVGWDPAQEPPGVGPAALGRKGPRGASR